MRRSPANRQFDVVKFKQSTLQQWNSAAEAWHRWGPLLSRWLGPATETMLDMCDIKKGSRVLDVAAGAGEKALAVAKRIGNNGHILATDISEDILHFAATPAKLAGMNNVKTQVIDGDGWIGTLQHIAREGCCWVVGCGNLMKGSDIPQNFPQRETLYPGAAEWVNPGDSHPHQIHK